MMQGNICVFHSTVLGLVPTALSRFMSKVDNVERMISIKTVVLANNVNII